MTRARVLYDAGDWGVGELLLDGEVLLWHEHPVHGREWHGEQANGDHALAARLGRYFRGQPETFDDITLDLTWCTPFQADVAQALRRISYGDTVTYGELAALAGHPGAHRAAGTLCAQNRFGIVLPCHRVIAANGLGGYGSLGLRYKERLLRLEGAAAV